MQRTNVRVDQTEAFFHERISRFLLLEQSHQEGGEKRYLFLPAPGFHQLTCQIESPALLRTYPSGSKLRGIASKEGFEGGRLENHMHRCESCFFVCHDAGLDHGSREKEGRWAKAASRMGDDVFKSSVPLIVMKDHSWRTSGRDFNGHSFLATIVGDPYALYLVFEDGWRWENGKVDRVHTTH